MRSLGISALQGGEVQVVHPNRFFFCEVGLPLVFLEADFRAGRAVAVPYGPHERHVFVRDESRTLVGVGEMHGALLAPQKVFV